MHAVAQHRMGLVAQTNKNFGEAVARMKVWRIKYLFLYSILPSVYTQKAVSLLADAEKRGEGNFKPYVCSYCLALCIASIACSAV